VYFAHQVIRIFLERDRVSIPWTEYSPTQFTLFGGGGGSHVCFQSLLPVASSLAAGLGPLMVTPSASARTTAPPNENAQANLLNKCTRQSVKDEINSISNVCQFLEP
jgi:hypothetical protein